MTDCSDSCNGFLRSRSPYLREPSPQKRTPLFWACLSQEPSFVPITPNGKQEMKERGIETRLMFTLWQQSTLA